ncbi:YncE family protein [Ureibacillus sp. FSL K6-8385]|uniref:YncE family protein n=1 Tax=Ureibacillus terrenus TaxID=118246 RepID=A0A540V1V3_9BACL|nr:YncE family protein [Ureibacillus terrenus]MED3661043.1 YncE family protein [Ureibacillus terrenus]MED3763329.1 YncE family protein [Ureibacillus terrenus]TQE90744.1 YncE family protein [Ureibacillus terrenus]
MKKWVAFLFLCTIWILHGCNDEEFQQINQHQSFVASVNILEPSVDFFDSDGERIATWKFEKAYTGAALIPYDRLVLYGHQLDEVDIYELSTGKLIQSIETGTGTTNVHYDKKEKLLFVANSESNTVASFNEQGEKQGEIRLKDYPMSMDSHDGKLYVVNYKAPVLSVVDIKSMSLVDEWNIDKSSSGLLIVKETNTLWVGGHGSGSRPNQKVKVLDLDNGQVIQEIQASQMPVGFSKKGDIIYVTNHGSNELFAFDLNGKMLWRKEVGANPFAVAVFKDNVIVAGFDDNQIYILENGEIKRKISTQSGPFQLLVREV